MRVSFDMHVIEEIKAVSKGSLIGREIIFYEATTSTNDKAMEIGEVATEGTVIIADAQERGKGRFGRSWASPPGVNLYSTVLLKPPFNPKDASLLTMMSAVSTATAIKELTGLNVTVKWPNDLLIGDKKVGGILTEMRSEMDRIIFVAIGIGINVNMSINILPVGIRNFTTSLMEEKGEPIDRAELLKCILGKMEYWYEVILKGNEKTLIDEWLLLNSTTGKRISIQTQQGIISGTAEGIDNEGALIVRLLSGDTQKVYAGEVTILKINS